MSPLGNPPDDLSRFPRRHLPTRNRLWRIFRPGNGRTPWWFSSDGSGRFDLRPPGGACYLAEVALGSFVEVFRDIAAISESDVEARRLATLTVPRSIVLADCTSRRARAFGVTAAIHSTEDYAKTQRWARAFTRDGFGGVRYFVSHDPAQRLVGVAVFGEAGQRDWPYDVGAICNELLRAAREEFGIVVLPAPG